MCRETLVQRTRTLETICYVAPPYTRGAQHKCWSRRRRQILELYILNRHHLHGPARLASGVEYSYGYLVALHPRRHDEAAGAIHDQPEPGASSGRQIVNATRRIGALWSMPERFPRSTFDQPTSSPICPLKSAVLKTQTSPQPGNAEFKPGFGVQ